MEARKENGSIASAHKGDTPQEARGYAALFVLKIADDFIDGALKTSSLKAFVEYWDSVINAKAEEIRSKSASKKKWEVKMADGSTYDLSGGKKAVAVSEALERLRGIDQFFKATVRLYWDATFTSDSFMGYLKWFPQFIKSN